MSELREQVARRLHSVRVGIESPGAAPILSPDEYGEIYVRALEAQADEVLRWMEWARRHGKKKRVTTPLGIEGDLLDWKLDAPPLTLPPDDWRP